MTGPISFVKQNLYPAQPELKDVLKLFKKNLFLEFNCHHVGSIQTFNPVDQTAIAAISYPKTFFVLDSSGNYVAQASNYPLLVNCPVVVMGGGNGALTFPIAPGDECIVMFNDRDLDNWFHSGNIGTPVNSSRLHSFSDAMILVGLRSMPNVLVDYNATGVELRNRLGTSTLTIEANGDITMTTLFGFFTFKANSDIHFNTGTVEGLIGHGGHVQFKNIAGNEYTAALIQLFTDLAAGTDSMGLPLTMPTFPADLVKFQTFLEP